MAKSSNGATSIIEISKEKKIKGFSNAGFH
jgi:hypothetical protein